MTETAEAGKVYIDVEDIFEYIGHFGIYQRLFYVLICFLAVGHGYQVMSPVFVVYEQQSWCAVPRLENFAYEQQKYIAIPVDSHSKSYDKCHVFDLPWDNYTDEELLNWNRQNMTSSAPQTTCNDYVFDKSVFVNSLQSEWQLVCGSSWWVQMTSTAYMLGMLLGSLLSGFLADRYGRLWPMVAMATAHPILGVAANYAPNPVVYCLIRVALSTCAFGAFLVAFVLAMEIIGPKARTATSLLYHALFALGAMLVALYGFIIRDAHGLQMLMALPLFWTAFTGFVVYESPRWLVVQGRHDRAWHVIRKMAAINNRKLPDNLHFRVDEGKSVNQSVSNEDHWSDMFTYPGLRRCLLISCFLWFTDSLVYYGLGLNVQSLVGNVFLNGFLMSLVDIPALVIGSWASERFGRRKTLIASMFVAGISTVLCIPLLLTGAIPGMVTALSLVGKAGASLAFAVSFLITSEIFPTHNRQVAMGIASVASRLAGMAAPYAGEPLGHAWVALPSLLFGTCGLVAGGLTFLLPETINIPMPETTEQAEALATSHWKRDDLLIHEAEDSETCTTATGVPPDTIALDAVL